MTDVLRNTDTDTHRDKGHVRLQRHREKTPEFGVEQMQAKECQRVTATPKAKRRGWNRLSLGVFMENMA